MSTNNFFEQHLQIHTLRIELKSGRVLFYALDGSRKAELEHWMRQSSNDDMTAFVSPFLSFYSAYDRMTFVRVSEINRLIFLWDAVYGAADDGAYSDPFKITTNFTLEEETPDNSSPAEIPEWLQDMEEADLLKQQHSAEEEPPAAPVNPLDALLFGKDDPFASGDRLSDQAELDEPTGLDIPDAIVLTSDPTPYLYYDLNDEVEFISVEGDEGLNNLNIGSRFIMFNDADDEQNFIPLDSIVCLDVARRLVFDDAVWEVMERKRNIDNNLN